MTNPTEVNLMSTGVTLKTAVAPRPSQVADTEARGVTPKVGPMAEEINVFHHSLSFWLGMLRWPIDGSQTQGSGYGTGGGGGGGTQRRGSSGSGGQSYDDNTGCRSSFLLLYVDS